MIDKKLKEYDEQFPISHYYCEDSWYSCPKAEDGCADELQGDKCNCGAEEKHKERKAFIRKILEEQHEKE